MKKLKQISFYRPAIASLLIRIGLAIVFTYAAIGAFIEPRAWISFLPSFATTVVPAKLLLDVLSVVQLILAVWLLSGKYLMYSALLAAGLLMGIVISNFSYFVITFRDTALALAAIALVFLNQPPDKK